MDPADDDLAPAGPVTAPALSVLLIQLLKGVLYRDDNDGQWANLLRLQTRVREHAGILLLDLVVDEAEGYAFLRSRAEGNETEAGQALPRLVARRPLSFPVSLMIALLRKRLAEFDASGSETRLVLSRQDIAELMRVFLPEGTNEARLIDRIDTTIARVVDLGFLRWLKPEGGSTDRQRLEVRRIIKAYVDAQWLADFAARLENYRTHLADTGSNDSDG